MHKIFAAITRPLISLAALMMLMLGTAQAKDVKIEFQGFDLLGDLALAKGKNLKQNGVIVVLHDVLSSMDEEPVVELRLALLAKGFNVLAINLSLGLDQRRGRYDCAVEQDHLYQDALPEIHAWVKWLQSSQKVKSISLLGIGAGGNQIALYGSKTTQKSVRQIILLAPTATTKTSAGQQYQQLHGKPLQDILFDVEAKIAAEQSGALLEKTGFLICPQARVTVRSFASYYAEKPHFDVTTLIRVIKKPVLVLASELGDASKALVEAMQQIEARANLRLDVVGGADQLFSGPSMGSVAERIKLFKNELKGK